MKSKVTIKNFRVFDENGVSFEINPITILTGSNSSGKSTVVKAIFFLNSFLSQIRKALDNGNPIEINKYKLDFTTYPYNLLGRFDKVINDKSTSNKLTIEYTVHSLMISQDVTVQLVFSANEKDELNNAFLDSIIMSTEKGIFYSSQKDGGSYCNLNIIKAYCFDFLLIECVVNSFYSLKNRSDISDEKYTETRDAVINYLHGFDKTRRDDIIRYVHLSNSNESIIQASKSTPQIIEDTRKNNTFFKIQLIDELDHHPKDEVGVFIQSILQSFPYDNLENVSNKVLKDFHASSYSKFGEYFRDYETNFLNHIQCDSSSNKTQSGVHLLQAKELVIQSQNYTAFNPHDPSPVYTIGTNGEFMEKDEITQPIEKKTQIEDVDNSPVSFESLYEIVMKWNFLYSSKKNSFYTHLEPSNIDSVGNVYHYAYKILTMFAEALVQEVSCPDWCGNMSYVSSARARVNRLYTLDNKDDFSLLLKSYFEKKRIYLDYQENNLNTDRRNYVIDSFMNRWIEKFEIGKAISLHVDKDGLGVQIRLHKKDDEEGRILADEGYGITQLVSIILQIETAILSAEGEKINKFDLIDSLDCYDTGGYDYKANTIAIEEPEIHLHPKYQSLLADMFLDAYENYNIHFILETHSEYLIRKAQVFVYKHQYQNEEAMSRENPFKVYYVPRDDMPYEMNFRTDGRFNNEFGKGFFDEATNLAFEIL